MATTQLTQPRRSRRGKAAVVAGLLLLIGVGLLWFSFFVRDDKSGSSQAAPSPSTIMSPMVVAAVPTVSPGATLTALPTIVYTTQVAVPTMVAAPVQPAGPDILGLVTTFSGLLASVAGLISAIVSIRSTRAR